MITPLRQELEDQIARDLEPGEQVVWMDQPLPRFFTAESLGPFLLSIPFTAFVTFWIYGSAGFKIPDIRRGTHGLFPLFGLPFLFACLFMMAAPLRAYRKARRSMYAITNRRAILLEVGWKRSFRSFPPEDLKNIQREEDDEGYGDIVFAQDFWVDSHGAHHDRYVGFLNVREPKVVEQHLRGLAQRAAGSMRVA
jgi:hypothetical protein